MLQLLVYNLSYICRHNTNVWEFYVHVIISSFLVTSFNLHMCTSIQYTHLLHIQWNYWNSTPELTPPPPPDILWHLTTIYRHKVFLLTKIKPEYSEILYNQTHFPGPFVCWIRQVPLYNFFYFSNLPIPAFLFFIYFNILSNIFQMLMDRCY